MTFKIMAAIASYNDEASLAELMAVLVSQERSPDQIYIIDNSDIPLDVKSIDAEGLSVVVKRPGINVGWSGAYEYAFEAAKIDKFDLIWFLDQDSRPEKKCLKKLIRSYRELDKREFGMIAPLAIDDSSLSIIRPGTVTEQGVHVQEKYNFNGSNLAEVEFPITSGTLLSSNVADIAVKGIHGMMVDSVDWIVAFNLLRNGKKNYIHKDTYMHHNMGEHDTYNLKYRTLNIRYGSDRLFMQCKNRLYFLGYISSAYSIGWRSIFRVLSDYIKGNLALLLVGKQSLRKFLGSLSNMIQLKGSYENGKRNSSFSSEASDQV